MGFLDECATLIDMFNMGPLDAKRPGARTRTAYGDYDGPAESALTLDPIHVQEATGEELDRVPEADRTKRVIRIYTRQALRKKDRISYDGDSFIVIRAENLDPHGSAYISHAEREELAFSTGAP